MTLPKYATDPPVEFKPIEVTINYETRYDENGKRYEINNFDRAIKAFRAVFQKERILSLYKEKSRFEKPSDKKRRKRNESKRKIYETKMKELNYKKPKEEKDVKK